MRSNIHFLLNPGNNASRVLKETKSMVEDGYFSQTVIIGIDEEEVFKNNEIIVDENRKLIRLGLIKNFSNNRFLKAILKPFALIQMFFKEIIICSQYKPQCINAHTIILLPFCCVYKFFFRCYFIYDPHELETEVDGLRGLKKKYLKWIERVFINYADSVIVVSENIADWYRKRYKLKNIYVVRNVPYLNKNVTGKTSLLREEFLIPDDRIVFLYNGFLTNGRGIEMVLKVFSNMTVKEHIIFMGYGPKVELVKKYQEKHSNIHFKPAVAPDEVIKYTVSADVGLVVIENSCLSYYYSLSNKLFEYIQSGLPVIVSDFPDMAAIIDKYRCGWKVNPKACALSDCISNMTKANIQKKREMLNSAKSDFCWEKESLIYREIFTNSNFTINKSNILCAE